MPSRACVSGEARVTSSPWKRTDPAVGTRSPERQLKNVDLPAPFGPIRPMMSPSWTSRSASDTARKLPNNCVTERASSSMAGIDRLGCLPAGGEPVPELEQAARLEARQQQDDAPIEDVGQTGSTAPERAVGGGLQRHQDDRADQRAEQGADAAERRRDDHLDGHQDAEAALRVDEAHHQRIERAGERSEGRAEHKRVELVAAGRTPPTSDGSSPGH